MCRLPTAVRGWNIARIRAVNASRGYRGEVTTKRTKHTKRQISMFFGLLVSLVVPWYGASVSLW